MWQAGPSHLLLNCSRVFLRCATASAEMAMTLGESVGNLRGHIPVVTKDQDHCCHLIVE